MEEASGKAKKPEPKGKGAPRRPGFRSVLARAGFAAIIFFIFLIAVAGDSPAQAGLFTLGMFVLMIPVGVLIDRMTYRLAVRRWERRRAGGA